MDYSLLQEMGNWLIADRFHLGSICDVYYIRSYMCCDLEVSLHLSANKLLC